MKAQIIQVNAYLVFEIKSKRHWINSFPGALPKIPMVEKFISIDKNGNSANVGSDFMEAETQDSYPIKIYLLERIAHKSDPQYLVQLLNLFK